MEDQEIVMRIRWFIQQDLLLVMDIERECFENPWSEVDFARILRQGNIVGMVVECESTPIAGFMFYELHRERIKLVNFAVDPGYRRLGVGSNMVQKLKDKLSFQRRKELLVDVRERNLGAQLFFRSQGFRAVQILRNHFLDTSEDAYRLRWGLEDRDCVLDWIRPGLTGSA